MTHELVECYAGRHYPQRPKALWWEGERLEIDETERHWRSQGTRYSDPTLYHYYVRTARGSFHLIYDTTQDEWQVTKTGDEERD
ncbi:MAG TPA: hypothetical protein VF960_04945 [Chloroflexota bacterium]